MDVAERAYLAGILDGEGCLSVYTREKKYITPTVQISNTKRALLRWIQRRLGGSIYAYAPRVGNRKQCYLWSCAGEKARNIVREARPYLVIKKKQADVLLTTRRKNGSSRLTPEDVQHNLAVIRHIRELNHRGK